MYTGAYEYPPPTLTGGVRTDIMHIEQCVGVGEVAVSDSRSSAPTTQELARLALGMHHSRGLGQKT
jgi:beta-aspartyl-dipeptidase (metallo-type)